MPPRVACELLSDFLVGRSSRTMNWSTGNQHGRFLTAEMSEVQMIRHEQVTTRQICNPELFTSALQRLNQESDLLVATMRIFLDDAPCLLDELRTSIKENDFSRLHSAAHRLKGILSGYDHSAGTLLARDLEDMGRHANIADASLILGELETEVAQLSAEIRSYLRANKTSVTTE